MSLKKIDVKNKNILTALVLGALAMAIYIAAVAQAFSK